MEDKDSSKETSTETIVLADVSPAIVEEGKDTQQQQCSNSDDAARFATSSSPKNTLRRAFQLSRSNSIGTESESSSRTNSPMMDRANYKKVKRSLYILLFCKIICLIHQIYKCMRLTAADSCPCSFCMKLCRKPVESQGRKSAFLQTLLVQLAD